jgi:hypothetical protein
VFRRQSSAILDSRLGALEDDVRSLQRETAELRAAHDDAIELALIHAVLNVVHGLITEARERGWSLGFARRRPELYGTILLGHPTDAAHDYSIDLPVPDDPAVHRSLVSELRMRMYLAQAA